jgi:hypothetical protein
VSRFSLWLHRLAATRFRHSADMAKIVTEVVEQLPKLLKLRGMTDDERREQIVAAVEAIIDARYPAFAPFIDVIIDVVVARVRIALEKR